MKHFRNVGAIELTPLRNALSRYAHMFEDQTWRQDYPGSAHRDSETIYLRLPSTLSVESIFESLEVSDLPLMRDFAFESACQAISQMTRDQTGRPMAGIARVMLMKLKAGGKVTPHIDQGAYAEATERYHLPIVTNPDVLMTVEDEAIHMADGEVWWFDKHSLHSVANNGPDRVHLIVDVFK